MIVYDVKQGSPEWMALRCGVPTASNFDKILTPGRKASRSAEPYMFTLLGERMMGHPEDDFKSSWMQRGSEVEGDAINFYELQKDVAVTPVGFISNDAKTWGASPDALVGDEGQLEIKCPKAGTHVSYMMETGGAYEEYRVQVQGQLWVANRQWCDVVSFHPEMSMALTRIVRDDDFIADLSRAVAAFSARLEAMSLDLIERGDLRPDWKPSYAPKVKREREHPPTASQIMRESLLDLKRDVMEMQF